MPFQKEDVLTTVAAVHVHLSRVLLRGKHRQCLVEFRNLDDGLVALERSRYSDLQVLLFQKLRCDVS